MREKIRDKGRLEHILNSIQIILDNKGKYRFEDIKEDPIIFLGFVKQVEIISEAAYMLSKEFRQAHPQVDWEGMEGMRHVLVHGYYTIKPLRVWDAIENDIPQLKPFIEQFLREME